MIKNLILLIASSVLIAGCARHSDITVTGIRDGAGVPTGAYKLTGNGVDLATGAFSEGKMQGKWAFVSGRNTRLAEVIFEKGVPHGKYKTYYGATAFPESAGKLQSVGVFEHGKIREIKSYDRNGNEFVSAAVGADGVISTSSGKEIQAERVLDGDLTFIRTLQSFVMDEVSSR